MRESLCAMLEDVVIRFKFIPAPRIALMNDIRRERTTAARIMDFRRVPIQDRISYESVESSRCHAGGRWVSMRIESESRLELTGLIPFELVKDNTDTGSHTHSFGHGARSGGSIYTWLVSNVRTGSV